MDETGRLPTLPHSCLCSTIGAEELNYRVRDGNGWVLLATVTQKASDRIQNPEWKNSEGRKAPAAPAILNSVS